MKKFICLYVGPATPMEEMSEEDRAKNNEAWKAWMTKVGSSIVDLGAPMGPGKAVVDNDSMREAGDVNGYSILSAESMDKALELVMGHPFLSAKTGNFSVEVYELLPIEM
ncbi:MAG: hypothetical protein ACHQUB_01920 [Candidatus Saccharimonadia bacterium]